MKYLLIDSYQQYAQFFDDSESLLEFWDSEEIGLDSYRMGQCEVYEIPNDLKKVTVVDSATPRYAISGGTASETLATAGTLPAPLEGETVADYARRLTNS